MVIFSLGLPGRFAEWCDAILTNLIEHAFGAALASPVNTIEELALVVMRADTPRLVACCRHPSVRLQTEIMQTQKPFVIALDDPRASLFELLAPGGLRVADAVRPVASSCATMLALGAAPGALIVSGQDRSGSLAVVTRIARHLGLALNDIQINEVVAQIGRMPEATGDSEQVLNNNEIQTERALIDGALVPYIGCFAGGELAPLVWEAGVFFAQRKEGRVPAVGPIDVTGLARCLVYGPYINLPPGVWTADIVLAFSAETVGLSFIIDVWVGVQLAETRIAPSREQVIEVNLTFTVGDSATEPVEIRIFNERAAFDGRMALGSISLTRIQPVGEDVRAHLTEVLHR